MFYIVANVYQHSNGTHFTDIIKTEVMSHNLLLPDVPTHCIMNFNMKNS